MPARRIQSLRHGEAAQSDGVVWHREHRSKKGRWPRKRYEEWRKNRARKQHLAKKYRRYGGWPGAE